MGTMKTLIIIDMQPYFSSAKDNLTIAGVIKEIQKACRYRWPIMVVEYINCGPTDPHIMEEVKKHNSWIQFSKEEDDGSSEIIEMSNKHSISLENLIICGVNTDCCVFDTVQGLTSKISPQPQITIVQHACNTSETDDVDHEQFETWFNKPNMKII
jgi:nicotinamidase-related amidase